MDKIILNTKELLEVRREVGNGNDPVLMGAEAQFEKDRAWFAAERVIIRQNEREATLREVVKGIEGILEDANVLRDLERQIIGYISLLSASLPGRELK